MPVNTVSRRFGISMLTSLRLLTRAPWTRIRSWLSAACVVIRAFSLSTDLLDPDHVPGGVADGAVAAPPRLLGRLLDDLRVGCLELLERAVEVGGRQHDA